MSALGRNRPRLAVLAAVTVLLVAGCSASDDGKNAPLPRASKAQTQAGAQALAQALASTVKSTVRPDPGDTKFSSCLGEHDEEATDARYDYVYSAYIPVPVSRQLAASRAIKAYLKARGYDFDQGSPPPDVAKLGLPLDADGKDWSLGLDSVTLGKGAPDAIAVGIYSECLMPPGAKQEKQ